jgi:hypothetical protein
VQRGDMVAIVLGYSPRIRPRGVYRRCIAGTKFRHVRVGPHCGRRRARLLVQPQVVPFRKVGIALAPPRSRTLCSEFRHVSIEPHCERDCRLDWGRDRAVLCDRAGFLMQPQFVPFGEVGTAMARPRVPTPSGEHRVRALVQPEIASRRELRVTMAHP